MPTGTNREWRRYAATIGPGVPRGDFAVRVHGTSRSALHLRLDGNAMLITLLGAGELDSPQALRLASAEDFLTWDLQPGTEGFLGSQELVLGRSSGPAIQIDLSGAERISPPAIPPIDSLGSIFLNCVRELDGLQEHRGCDLRIAALFGEATVLTEMGQSLVVAARRLGIAAAALDCTRARSAIMSLLGLGPGSTPAGDDFLCGFLLALRCAAGDRVRRHAFLDELHGFLLDRLSATSDLSASFLRCALQALTPTALAKLAAALVANRGEEALAALRQVCASGHSSGADLSSGFLFGLKVWAKTAVPRSMCA